MRASAWSRMVHFKYDRFSADVPGNVACCAKRCGSCHYHASSLKKLLDIRQRTSSHVGMVCRNVRGKNHLRAEIRMDLRKDSKWVNHFDLGPCPQEFFPLQVTIQNGVLGVWIDKILKLTHNWQYLDLPQNYFKTGKLFYMMRHWVGFSESSLTRSSEPFCPGVYVHKSLGGSHLIEYIDLFMGKSLGPPSPPEVFTSVPTSRPTSPPTFPAAVRHSGRPTLQPTVTTALSFPTQFPTRAHRVVPHITRLVLLDAAQNQDVSRPALDTSSWVVLDRFVLPPFTICAHADDSVGSVLFYVNGKLERKESFGPYCIAGDHGGDYVAWNVGQGEYKIIAIPFSEKSGGGTHGFPVSVTLWIIWLFGNTVCSRLY